MIKKILNLIKIVTAQSISSTLSMKTQKKTRHSKHKLLNTRNRGDTLVCEKKASGIRYKWYMPVIPALGILKQDGHSEFEASLDL